MNVDSTVETVARPQTMVAIALPAGPCTPGFTQVLTTACDASGEAYGGAAWADPVELEQSIAAARSARERKTGKCGGCGGHGAGAAFDVVAVFNAGKEAFKDGVMLGIDLVASGRVATYIPKYAVKKDVEELNRKAEKIILETAASQSAFTNQVSEVAKVLPTIPEAK